MIGDQLYGQVAAEIATGQIDPALWAKALAHSGGGENATRSYYIRFRVEQLDLAFNVALKQIRSQERELVQRLKSNVAVRCKQCGEEVTAKVEPRGDATVCIALYLLFIVPGLIYTLRYSGSRFSCPRCLYVLHEERFRIA